MMSLTKCVNESEHAKSKYQIYLAIPPQNFQHLFKIVYDFNVSFDFKELPILPCGTKQLLILIDLAQNQLEELKIFFLDQNYQHEIFTIPTETSRTPYPYFPTSPPTPEYSTDSQVVDLSQRTFVTNDSESPSNVDPEPPETQNYV